MKLNVITPTRGMRPASSKKVEHKFPSAKLAIIQRSNFDRHVMYVGKQVHTPSIASKAIGTSVPTLNKVGYLLVHGDRPGLLLHKVKWDGKDVYEKIEDGSFGTLSALNSVKKKFFAEILSKEELAQKAIEFNEVVEVMKLEDNTTFTVALLNSMKQPYSVGIYMKGRELHYVNMEPKADYNRRRVWYQKIKTLPIKAAKFLGNI